MSDSEQQPPIHERSWGEIGKYFTVFAGRWAIRTAAIGAALYFPLKVGLESTVNPKIDEQGDKLTQEVKQQGQSAQQDIQNLKGQAEGTFKTVDEFRIALCQAGLAMDNCPEDLESSDSTINIEINSPEDSTTTSIVSGGQVAEGPVTSTTQP